MNAFLSNPIGLFFACLLFVVLGFFIINDPNADIIQKIAGYACIGFFGLGGIMALGRMFMAKISSKNTTAFTEPDLSKYATEAGHIQAESVTPADDENLEEWKRTGAALEESYQQVDAYKTADSEYAWTVYIWSAEYLGKGAGIEQMSKDVCQALSEVSGVKSVFHEDREKWIVDGECEGKELVLAASLANDIVMRKWESGGFGD